MSEEDSLPLFCHATTATHWGGESFEVCDIPACNDGLSCQYVKQQRIKEVERLMSQPVAPVVRVGNYLLYRGGSHKISRLDQFLYWWGIKKVANLGR